MGVSNKEDDEVVVKNGESQNSENDNEDKIVQEKSKGTSESKKT